MLAKRDRQYPHQLSGIHMRQDRHSTLPSFRAGHQYTSCLPLPAPKLMFGMIDELARFFDMRALPRHSAEIIILKTSV
jgi:hypothetical protein